MCNRFSRGVLHCTVREEIQDSCLPAWEAVAYLQPYPRLVLCSCDIGLTTCHGISHKGFVEVNVSITTGRDELSDYLVPYRGSRLKHRDMNCYWFKVSAEAFGKTWPAELRMCFNL